MPSETFQIPIRSMVKSVGPRLVPFFKSIAVYFILYGISAGSTLFYAGVKIAPVVSLIAFVLLNGTGFSNQYYIYSRRILAGLVASVIGDILILGSSVGDAYLVAAMIAFSVAHVFYAAAFGMKPFNLPALSICIILYGILVATIISSIDFILAISGASYALILTVMVWRGVSRLQFFDDLWTWTKLCSCVGAILFAISDTILAYDLLF